MSLFRSFSIFRHNVLLLIADLPSLIGMTIMPLIMMLFLQPASRAVLVSEGYTRANGAEQVVPGMAVLFVFLSMTFTGAIFFREHVWGTWERLRASNALPLEMMIGKCFPAYLLTLVQLTIFFLVGVLMFGLHIQGSLIALALVMISLAFCLIGLAMLWVAISRSLGQFLILANLIGMFFTGIGGALAPTDALPSWAQVIAPISPAYWALQGFRTVILNGGDINTLLVPIVALIGFGAVSLLFASLRFRFAETKVAST